MDTEKTILKNYKFIDLFAGIGGFRIALESYGATCVFSSEWDKYAKITYKANFGEEPEGDITLISEKEIPSHDILCAGFPCQPFSISGKQLGFNDARGTLFFDIARITKYHYPKILFLENVKNFEKHDNGNTLKCVISILNDIGYRVWYKVLNAGYYGVPQKRERIYIVCIREDLKVDDFKFPEPTYEPVKLRDILLPDSETKDFIINRNDIFIDKDKIPSEVLFNRYPLKPIRIGIINKGGQGERIYSDLGHAITLSAYGGGVASKTGAYLINGVVRKLAPLECAYVQGFPKDFKIPVPKTQAYQQFGNSVAVPVLKHIIKAIAELPQLKNSELIYDEKAV